MNVPPVLAEVILGGDRDAFSGFRDSRLETVRRYAEAVCGPERTDRVVQAAFAGFVGRLRASGSTPADIDLTLRLAARDAAAAHTPISERGDLCSAVPELLAAQANGELKGSADRIDQHLKGCRRCRSLAERLVKAEPLLQTAA